MLRETVIDFLRNQRSSWYVDDQVLAFPDDKATILEEIYRLVDTPVMDSGGEDSIASDEYGTHVVQMENERIVLESNYDELLFFVPEGKQLFSEETAMYPAKHVENSDQLYVIGQFTIGDLKQHKRTYVEPMDSCVWESLLKQHPNAKIAMNSDQYYAHVGESRDYFQSFSLTSVLFEDFPGSLLANDKQYEVKDKQLPALPGIDSHDTLILSKRYRTVTHLELFPDTKNYRGYYLHELSFQTEQGVWEDHIIAFVVTTKINDEEYVVEKVEIKEQKEHALFKEVVLPEAKQLTLLPWETALRSNRLRSESYKWTLD